jgi:deoxyribodipyrimidine photo-lyase
MPAPSTDRPTILFWFRQDLRLHDNPGLHAAAQAGRVLPVYILDDDNAGTHRHGAASRWWLHHSLGALNESLGGALLAAKGDPAAVIPRLLDAHQIGAVYWNRCYEPWRIARDRCLKQRLTETGIEVKSFNGSLLWEPWEVLKSDGNPYRVFTPFYRKRCLTVAPPRIPEPTPVSIEYLHTIEAAKSIPALELLPRIRWDRALEPHWTIGEAGARERLDAFLDHGLDGYADGRNFPDRACVSRLSPSLHFGEVSPNQAWHAARAERDDGNVDVFCSELGWREFSHSLLYHFPALPRDNLQPRFDAFPWRDDDGDLRRWQTGTTGYPIVDAGMRELWQTGYMHNRVRMIVGSFLVKNLLLHWHAGERWFWDCLVDADMANNSASWQWIAGCGADAAPYFRIFNPVTQGQKFDPDGRYTRRFCPELAQLPDKFLHCPWNAPADVLNRAAVKLGHTYPQPIVDLKASRERALDAFKALPKP